MYIVYTCTIFQIGPIKTIDLLKMEQYPPTQGDQGKRAREAMPNGEVQCKGENKKSRRKCRGSVEGGETRRC